MSVKSLILVIFIVLLGVFSGFFNYSSEVGDGAFAGFPFKLGLDLKGGTHLVYETDLASAGIIAIDDALNSLRDVIERRINIFGVSEPRVQVSKIENENGQTEGRLIVELPGVTDVDEAVNLIGATPVLDFRTENRNIDTSLIEFDEETGLTTYNGQPFSADDFYVVSELTGKNLKRATHQFNSVTGESYVGLDFDSEGGHIFAELTKDNIGRTIAIYLDGVPVSTPIVQNEITGGSAQITGNFTVEEVKTLVGRLNAGALPIPINLLSTQTIGASLGEEAVEKGINAGILGFIIVSLFFIAWYRLPGLLAVISLVFYLLTMFAIFKLIPVTLTAAGIAGFILSIGLAVDANVLIFERLKEELNSKTKINEAVDEAFARAWVSIRDANFTSIIMAVILFWFGTSLIKGFALTFGLGVLISMFSAIVFTKHLMLSFTFSKKGFLLGSGFSK